MRFMSELIYPDISYKLNGVLFSVHNKLGQFRSEKEYGDLIESYFKKLNINYEREKVLPSSFDNDQKRNRVDFLVEDKIILELKAKRFIDKEDYYQMKRYLLSLNKPLGILVNFRRKYITPKRIVNFS